MVPFAMESLGATGAEAAKLLLRMASHSLDKSPAAFLEHANRRLSAALQIGNAHVAVQGATDMLLHSYRSLSRGSTSGGHVTGARRSMVRIILASSFVLLRRTDWRVACPMTTLEPLCMETIVQPEWACAVVAQWLPLSRAEAGAARYA